MGLGKKQCFARNNGLQKGGKLYVWCTVPEDKRISNDSGRKNYCTATPRSQGEDWRVTYMYTITVINGVQYKVAYVECDYVK